MQQVSTRQVLHSHTASPLNNGSSSVCIDWLHRALVWLGNIHDGATRVEPDGLRCTNGDECNAALASMYNPLNEQMGAECPHLPWLKKTHTHTRRFF